MPSVEETLASYFFPESASSLKALPFSTKPVRTTSALVGKAYLAVGQAVACMYTMSILLAYPADLLRDLDEGKKVSSDAIKELRWATDLFGSPGDHGEALMVKSVQY